MGNTFSRCFGQESKAPERKRKQSELEIALFEQPKVDSYMGLPLPEAPEDVSDFVHGFVSWSLSGCSCTFIKRIFMITDIPIVRSLMLCILVAK